MVINNQVRNEVVNILADGGLKKIKFFHNGRKTFHDLEEELPAVCVFIDESECDEFTACEDEWEGNLQIAIYLPLHSTEDDLDAIAEEISNLMKNENVDSVDGFKLKKYSYDYDPNENLWISATLTYLINYFR